MAGLGGRLLPYIVAGAALVGLLVVSGYQLIEPALWLAIGALILVVGGRPWFLAGVTALVLVLATVVPGLSTEFRARSFFGVTEVRRDGDMVVLMNGTTVHGTQWMDPARRSTPTTYYGTRGTGGRHLRGRRRQRA